MAREKDLGQVCGGNREPFNVTAWSRLSIRPALEVRGGGMGAEEDNKFKGQVQAFLTNGPELEAGPRPWTSYHS